MNTIDHRLARLFRAAARAQEPPPAEAPFGFESEIIRRWRGGVASPEGQVLPLIRGAFVCACALILITAALALQSLGEAPPNELVIVDSVIRLSLMQ